MSKPNTATKKSTKTPPAPPSQLTKEQRLKLPITDHRRPLTKEQRKALSPDEKKARRASKRAARGPWKLRAIKTTQRMIRKIERFAKAFSGVESVDEDHFTTAVAHLKEAVEEMAELPDAFTPKGSSGGGTRYEFTVGQIVQMSESKREQYAGYVPEESMGELQIVGAGNKRVVVEATTKGGAKIRLFLPAGHVKPVASVEE